MSEDKPSSDANQVDIGAKFLECVDVLEKIKRFKEENSKGETKHYYTVKTHKSGNFRSSSNPRLQSSGNQNQPFSARGNVESPNHKHENEKTTSQLSLPKLVLPPVISIKRNAILDESMKSSDRRQPATTREKKFGREAFLRMQLEPISMIQVDDPAAQTLKKTQWRQKLHASTSKLAQTGFIRAIRVNTSAAPSEKNSTDGFQNRGRVLDISHSDRTGRSDDLLDMSLTDKPQPDLGKLRLVDAVQLELGLMQEDSVQEGSNMPTARGWKKAHNQNIGVFAGQSAYNTSTSFGLAARKPGSQNTARLQKYTRRSFLRSVLESTRIVPPAGHNIASSEIDQRKQKLFESVAGGTDHHLFADFLDGFGEMLWLFGEFRVKEIFNFKDFPLERFGQPPEPERDILMRLEQSNRAMSRWVDGAGVVSWRPCLVEKYDKVSGKFTINWQEGPGSTKQVSRLNIVLNGEKVEQFDQIKKSASAIRCQYLLEQSIKDTLLSKDALENCRVYFRFDQFKNLIIKSGLYAVTSDSPEFASNLAQEILEEYALGILRFFALYKSSESYDHFIDDIDQCGGHSIGYTVHKNVESKTQGVDYLIQESLTCLLDFKLQTQISNSKNPNHPNANKVMLLATWGRTAEGLGTKIDQTMSEAMKLSEMMDNVFYRTIFTFGGYILSDDQKISIMTPKPVTAIHNLILEEHMSKDSIAPRNLNTVLAQESHQVINTVPATPAEDPADHLTASDKELKTLVESTSTFVMATVKSCINICDFGNSTAHMIASPNISKTISALGKLVSTQFLEPLDLQLGHIALCHSAIRDIEELDIFSSFGGRGENQLTKALKCIEWVQQDFGLLRDEYISLLEPMTDDKRIDLGTRFTTFSKCLNEQLKLSTAAMLENSARRLGHFLERLAVTLQIEQEYQEQIDFLLSKRAYILKRRGQQRYNLVPAGQQSSIHPNKLETYSPFRRRVGLFMSHAGHFATQLGSGGLRVRQGVCERSLVFAVTPLVGLRVVQRGAGGRGRKGEGVGARGRVRSENRERIYAVQDYFEEKYDAVVRELANVTTTAGLSLFADELRKMETSHVVSGMLGDMVNEFGAFEFRPSLGKIEKDLKEELRKCLAQVKTLPRLGAGKDVASPDPSPLQTPPSLPEVLFSLDCLLSDAFICLLAFLYTLQSFSHLLPAEKSLVHEELKQLIEQDNLDPLETEVHQLLKDKQTLENLLFGPKDKQTKYTLGPFSVDCQDVVKTMLLNVEDCIKKVFEPHVYKKFDSLIANNKDVFVELRERLLSPVSDIDRYIEMKRFVEGEELVAMIEKIRHDIRLCRRLNKFEEETRFMSDLISNDYLESLSWVTELTHLQELAQMRIKKALPQFKEELVKIQERLTKEFEQTKILMKEFETYSEDQEAENYHLKARELMAALESYLLRALDLIAKQEIIGVKKSGLDTVIQNEKLAFSKYLDLWGFIDGEWNPKHEVWKKEPFAKLDKADMAAVIGNGLALLRRLQEAFKDNEVVTKLVRTKQNEVNKFSKVLEVVKILKDPSFKDRHWDDLFQHIKEADSNDVLGLKEGRPDLTKITLGQLMLANIVAYLPVLKMIEIKANMESDIELRIKKIRQSVESIVIKPTIFDLDGSGLSIITRTREINSELNEHLGTCLDMLSNPECPEELVKELRLLANLLGITTRAFTSIQSVQQKLIRFSPIFKFKELERFLTRKDTTSQFLKLREEFKKVLALLEEKKIGFFTELVTADDEDAKEGAKAAEFLAKLQGFNTTSDYISQSLTTFFKMIRLQSPRYFYTTDEQMLTLCSLIKFPRSFIGFVTTLFRGLQNVTTGNVVEGGESDSVEITAVTNMMGEVMRFQKSSVIELATNAEIPLISIVKELERQTSSYLERERRNSLVSIANLHFDFGMIYHHWHDKHISWQTMAVCIQMLFDLEVSMILRNHSAPKPKIAGLTPFTPDTRKSVTSVPVVEKLTTTQMLKVFRDRLLKSVHTFVQFPVRFLKDKLRNAGAVTTYNGYIMMVQGLVDTLDYLELSDVRNFEDFAYQLVPKYSVTFENELKTDPVTGAVVDDEFEVAVTKNLKHRDVVRNEQYIGSYTTNTPLVEEFVIGRGQKLVMTMMGHSLDYKYEVQHTTRHTNSWPLLERTFFSMWLAMCTCPHIIMRGFKSQGKLETLRALNQRVAANYFECDMSFGNDIGLVTQFIYGMISGGYWLVFKNMEKAPTELLSVMASFANEVRQSVAAKRTKIRLNDQELLIMGSHLILCTYNIDSLDASRKFEELSTNITDQFRIISIHAPNFQVIISGLVSGVFDSEQDKSSWVSKLLFFCKTYQQAEISTDLSNEARGTLMTDEELLPGNETRKPTKPAAGNTEKDFLLVPPTGFEENSVVTKLPDNLHTGEITVPQQMPDITLREISNIINRALVRYFKAIHAYYETFKEKDGTYRIDLQILQLNQERTAKFTQLFRSEILSWLQHYNPSSTQSQAQRILFDKLFAEDLAKMRTNMGQVSTSSHKEILTKLVATYKELDPKCNLPEEDKRTVKFLEPYTDLFLSCENGRQIIVCGDPNTQKSTLIKLLGLLESEMTNSKFAQYWLNLESLAGDDVFGNSKSPGILREILLHTNNINLEEKNTAAKLKYLFENSTDLFYSSVDPRLNKDGKIKKTLNKQNSWVVVDANSSKHNEVSAQRVNYLLRIFSNLYEMKEVNQFVGFSSKLRVVYEMSSLSTLQPSHVSDACVLYVRQGLMTPEDRITQWSRDLSKLHPFFKILIPRVTEVLNLLLLPMIVDFEDETKQTANKPAFAYDQRISFLNGVLSHLEIFLNEFRKMYVAVGLLEARRSSDTDTALKKLGAGPQTKASKPEQFSFGSGMKLAQEAGVSMIGQQRSKKTTLKKEEDHISGLKTIQDIDDFDRRKIEGLTVFSFITAAYPQLFCDQHSLLKTIVERQGANYCTKKSVSKNLFADGLFSMIADKKIGGITVDLSHFLYDFTKGRWVSWESVKIPLKVEISSSFTSDDFKKNELSRLGCQNTDAYFKAEASANEEMFTFVNPAEKNLVPTSNMNHMRYMLDLLLNYKKHVLLMSDQQQGKTSFLGNAYFSDLIQQREIITFNFVLQKGVTSKVIQTQMEDNLLGSGKNVVRPPQNKRVIVWIDDLQMSNDEEKPESLVRCLQVQGGWFSSNKKTFIKIEDCHFLMTFSGCESNKEATRMNLSSLNPDVLAKCTTFKTHKLSLSELSSIFFDQVKGNVDPQTSNEREKLIAKLFHQLAKVVYFNQDSLKSLSSNSLINLSVDSFNQLARSMSLVDWEDLSEKPTDVLFAWYKTLMSFLSCDFNFQKSEFEVIMKEKQAKMDLIKTTRRSTLFQSVKNHRLSIKLNSAIIEQLQAQMNPTKEGSLPIESSGSLGVQTKLIRKSSRLSIMPADHKKATDMQQINEEDHEDADDDSRSVESPATDKHVQSPGHVSSSQHRDSHIAPGRSERGNPSVISISEARPSLKQKSVASSKSKSLKQGSTVRSKLIKQHGIVLQVLEPDAVLPANPKPSSPGAHSARGSSHHSHHSQKSNKSNQNNTKRPYASPSGVVLSTKRAVLEKSASLLVDVAAPNAQQPAFHPPRVGGRTLDKSKAKPIVSRDHSGKQKESREKNTAEQRRRLSSNLLAPVENSAGRSKRGSVDQGGSRKGSANNLNDPDTRQPQSSKKSQISAELNSSSSGSGGSRSLVSAEEQGETIPNIRRSVVGSARELTVPESPKSQRGGSQRSIGDRSAVSANEEDSQGDKSNLPSSESSSQDDDNSNSPEEQDAEAEKEPSEEASADEHYDDENYTEEAKGSFQIDPLLPTNVFFRKFIEKTMDFKLPGRARLEELARSACFDMKFVFDQNLLKEMKDSKERKDDADEHTFYVPDGRGEQELMEFFKSKVLNFVKTHPDALLWLKLDGGNFPLFVHHFSMLSMSLLTDYQQLFISAVKSLHYAKAVIQFIGSTLGVQVDYIDLLAGNCKIDEAGVIQNSDAYEQLKDVVINTFADIWRLKKRIIILHIPNSSVNPQNKSLLDKVLQLISCLVLNTDAIQMHLGQHLKEMVDSAKKDKLYQHYSEFELRFTIRNRFQAKTIFVILNDSTQTYMPDSDTTPGATASESSNSAYMHMTDHFSKLTSKFTKLVVNGLKCLEPADTPSFYQPVIRIEETEMDALCARHLNTELNFLRCIDLEKEFFCLVRPFTENVVLYKACRNAIRLRLNILESDSASPECVRDKNIILQRIEKRKEVLALEIKEIDSQILAKEAEKEGVLAQEQELLRRRENWTAKKNDCRETIEKLHFSMAELIKEEGLYYDLKLGLTETLKSIREFRDKDLVQGVNAGYFTRSKAFAVYSVLFCELSKQMVVNDLSQEELFAITEDSIDRQRVQDYITIFEETISNFGSKFVDAIGALTASSISEKKCRFFCSLIENMRVGIEDPNIVSQMQRAVIRVIDTCIESIRLEQEKERRESELQQLKDSISVLEAQLERCSGFLNLIDKELAEQPDLITKIESRIEHLKKLKQTDLGSIQVLSGVVQSFESYQADFERTTQPLLDPRLNKDELADALGGLIAIYSKYPLEIKKKLLFTSMESTSLPSDIFDKLPPNELLSSNSLVVDIMRLKIPCNPNFLLNIAILDLLQEEQTLPWALLIDPAKLFLRYLLAKSAKAILVERLSPGLHTQDQLEGLLRSGGIFVAIDPDDEHMRLLRPIIDWQFRKFSENIILNNQQQIETSEIMNFFGKKITVNKQFSLFIILEGMHVAKIEQSILSKLIVLDNSVMSETGFCETLGDELATTLDSLARGYQISEHTSQSAVGVVAQQYRVLLQKGRNFDFLRDSLDSSGFLLFQNEAAKFEKAVKDFDQEQTNRKMALREYQNLQKELFKVVLPSNEDEREFHFLNCPFGYKVAEYIKISSKHLKFASRFWPYFFALNLMKSFLGDAFSVGYDLIAHIVKQNLASLEVKYPLPAEQDKKQELLPALFNEAERQVYFSLKNCLPGRFQYIFSFMLSVITLQRKYSVSTEGFRRMSLMPVFGSRNFDLDSGNENGNAVGIPNQKSQAWTTLTGLSQLLNQFLWSERVLGRNTRPVPFSTKLYTKFNHLIKELGGYYQDTQELLPMLLPRNKESCKTLSELTEQVDETYKQAVDAYKDVDLQERLLTQLLGVQFQKQNDSQSCSDAEPSDGSPVPSEPGTPKLKKNQSGTFESTKAESSLKLARVNSLEIRASASSRKELPKFVMPGAEPPTPITYLREIVPFYSTEGITRQLASELDFLYAEMKPKDFSGQKLTFDQILQVLKLMLSQLPHRTSLQLQIHSSGDPLFSLMPAIGSQSPVAGPEAERRTSKLILQNSSGSNKKSGFQSMFFAGLSQASVQSKLVSLNTESRKSLKNFAQIIVEKNKAQKATGQDFAKMFVDYIQEILSKVYGFNVKITPEDLDWNQFLVGPRIPKGQTNPDFYNPECPPVLPELPKEVSKWHLMGKLAVVKYARPDWIESFLSHSYSEIKGKDYLYSQQSLDQIYLSSNSKRCSVILYQRIDRSPAILLERLALKTGSKIFISLDALRTSLEEFVMNLDSANKKGNWIVVENLHLISVRQSTLMIKEAQSIIDKGASSGLRIWLLYKIDKPQLEIGIPGRSQLLPAWLSSCQYSFMEEACSVREELRYICFNEFTSFSTNFNSELVQQLSRATLNDIITGKVSQQNDDFEGIPHRDFQARSRLGSISSTALDAIPTDKVAIQRPKIVVQLPSDFISGTQQQMKGSPTPASPTASKQPQPSGGSTTKAASLANPSRFSQSIQKPIAATKTLQATNLNIPIPEPATPSKPVSVPSSPVAVKKVQTDIMSVLLRKTSVAATSFSNSQLTKRCATVLKLLTAVFRQRRKGILELLGEESSPWIEFALPKDRQLDQILGSILDLAVSNFSKDTLVTAIRAYVTLFFGDSSRLNDATSSPLLALQFIRGLLLESPPRADVQLDCSASRPYWIPSIFSAEQPGRILTEGILSLPTEDSPIFIGFRQNEQALIDFSRSKKCFAFLLQNIGNRLDLQVPSSAAEAQAQPEGSQPILSRNASTVQEVPTGDAAIESQEEGQLYFLKRFIKDNKKHSKNIVGRFFLNHIEYGYDLILNHEFQGELKSDLRTLLDVVISTIGDSTISSIQGVVDLQNAQDQQKKQVYNETVQSWGRSSTIGPGFVRSASKLSPVNPYSPEEMLAKVGYKPNNQGKMYLILNAQEQSVRSKGRRYLVSREWSILGSLVIFIKEQLKLARMSLVGDVLLKHRQLGRQLVEEISANKVPKIWHDRLRGVNISTESFKSLMQSVLLRIDSLYALAVESYPKLPPIIHVGRLVCPEAFLLQIVQFNSQLHNVSMIESVVMLFPKQSDKHKIYSNSTSWTVRGLKIRGGKLNEFSKLVPEDQGEYESDMGPLHLEITQFSKSYKRLVEVEPHIPIVLNTDFEEEPDPQEALASTHQKWLLQAEYSDPLVESRGSKEQLDYMAAALCPGTIRRQAAHNSEHGSVAATTRAKQTNFGGFSGALGVPPKVRDFGQIMRDAPSPFAKTPTRGSVLGIPQKQEESKPQEYRVRLPLQSGLSYNPLTQMQFFVYFVSSRPQEYWISRASAVKFSD